MRSFSSIGHQIRSLKAGRRNKGSDLWNDFKQYLKRYLQIHLQSYPKLYHLPLSDSQKIPYMIGSMHHILPKSWRNTWDERIKSTEIAKRKQLLGESTRWGIRYESMNDQRSTQIPPNEMNSEREQKKSVIGSEIPLSERIDQALYSHSLRERPERYSLVNSHSERTP